jgi:hypothetical protein
MLLEIPIKERIFILFEVSTSEILQLKMKHFKINVMFMQFSAEVCAMYMHRGACLP